MEVSLAIHSLYHASKPYINIMTPKEIKTPEQYEQLSSIVKKYHVLYFIGIKHKNTILYKEDVQLVSITFPNGCVIHYNENNTWKITSHKKAYSVKINTLSMKYDSNLDIPFIGFKSYDNTLSAVNINYKCILEYVYNGKTYTSNNIIQKKLIKH